MTGAWEWDPDLSFDPKPGTSVCPATMLKAKVNLPDRESFSIQKGAELPNHKKTTKLANAAFHQPPSQQDYPQLKVELWARNL